MTPKNKSALHSADLFSANYLTADGFGLHIAVFARTVRVTRMQDLHALVRRTVLVVPSTLP